MALPHLRYPFKITVGAGVYPDSETIPGDAYPRGLGPSRVATVDQGSPEEVAQSVYAVLATTPGARAENPEFGFSPQLFRQGGVDLEDLRDAVAEHEPRADLLTEAQFEGFVETVRIKIQ